MKQVSFRDRVTKGFAWTHLYKFAEYGLINLYNILVIRHFGPELVGPYALYLSAGTMLSLVGSFAVDGVLLRYTSHAFNKQAETEELLQEPQSFLQRLLAFRFVSVTLLSILALVALLFYRAVSPTLDADTSSLLMLWPYVLVFLFSQAVVAFSTFTMMGLLEARLVFISSLVSRCVLIAVGFFALTTNTLDLERAVQIHVGTSFLYAALLFIAMKRVVASHTGKPAGSWFRGVAGAVRQFVTSRKYLVGFLSSSVIAYGVTTWGTDILSSVLSRQPDILMLTAILGEKSRQIGYYQVGAMVLLLAEYALLFGLGGTLVAAFSSVAREDEINKESDRYPRLSNARRKVFSFQLAATSPLFVFLIFFAEPFVRLIFGAAYLPTVSMIQYGLVVLLVTVGIVGGGMHITSLVSIGRQRTVFKVRLIWGAINLVGNYFLILWLGAIGALLGTQLANMGACATEGIIADRRIGPSRNLNSVLILFATSLISVVLPWLIVARSGLDTWTTILVGAVMSVVLYLGLAIVFRIEDVMQVLDRLSQAFFKRPFPLQRRMKEVLL
jgi:O-antigen/teichoic acid export membrane protein